MIEIKYLSVTETTSPPLSQFTKLFMLYSQWLSNNYYLILNNILFINNVSIKA